jgi:hypothetical protein
MNDLYVKIKKAKQQYRVAATKEKNHRAKVKASVLSTLMGDIETKSKRGEEVTETCVIKLVKKYICDINETLKVKNNIDLETQKDALKVFVPRQLSDEELRAFILGEVSGLDNPTIRDMGKILSVLKSKHDGKYDGGRASKIAKDILTIKN